MNNFQPGHLLPVQFQPVGGPLQTLNITSQNVDLSSLLFDVTHTGFNGAGTARIAGKPDGGGNVTMDYDADVAPVSLQLTNGTSGIMLFFVTPTRPIQIPVIIEKVNYKSAVQGKCEFNTDVKMNILVGRVVYGTN
jgi:hypothetical protein